MSLFSFFGKEPTHVHESPREVFLAAATEICSHLEPLGFQYARSGPHAFRRSGEFKYTVWFQSSRKNSAESLVSLWIHASVESPRIRNWRRNYEPDTDDATVAGGQIGNLRPRSSWMQWNLANQKKRQAVIDDAVKSIRQIVFPVFELFEKPDELPPLLIESDLPAMHIGHVLEYLLCFHDSQAAEAAAGGFLDRHPKLEKDFHRHYSKYENEGLPLSRPAAYAPCIAYIALKHGLRIRH